MGSVVSGGEGSFGGCSYEPVVPDGGGEGEESSHDARVDASDGASAVVFEGELAFHRVEHGLNPLTDSAEFPEAFLLVFAVGSDQMGAEFVGHERFERGSGEALVANDHLSGVKQLPVVAEHRFGGFAFSDLGIRLPPDDRHAVRGAEQVEAESPEESGV